MHYLTPKLFTVLKNYNKKLFFNDLLAGVIVGIIAIPLSIALAISSGVSPEMGLYTAIVGGFIISFLGGSRVQIGGPTAAFIPIVYMIINKHGLDGMILATLMSGVFLILMAIFKMGRLIKFIPYPVVTGFTSGIALSILIKQFKDFFGMTLHSSSPEFIELCKQYIENVSTINMHTLFIGLISLLILIFWKKLPAKFSAYIPASLFAIIVATILVNVLHFSDVATIGSRYSSIKSGLPHLIFPQNISLDILRALIGPAFTIAVLAAIESLLSAVVADGMIGGHHRSNSELMGQGVANIFSVLLGGLPATGAIARTATNIRNGARTPIAGMIHAATILIIMLIFMPYVKLIPLTVLAAILLVVAYNIGDWSAFASFNKAPKSDSAVFIITFFLTVVFNIVIAIEVGIVLASFLFMRRMAELSSIDLVDHSHTDTMSEQLLRDKIYSKFKENVLLYEVKGPFFFGAAEKLMNINNQLGVNTKLIILKMKDVPAIDATGAHNLEVFINGCKKRNISVYICNLQKQPLKVLKKSGFINLLGEDHVCDDIESIAKLI